MTGSRRTEEKGVVKTGHTVHLVNNGKKFRRHLDGNWKPLTGLKQESWQFR